MQIMSYEMQSLKDLLKVTWMAGNYGHFAKYMTAGAMNFLKRVPLEPGTRMLDVACGAGQISIPTARAGADVTGVDIATNLIVQARHRAEEEGLTVRFDEGNAEMLPYEDSSFDLIVSLIGAMFAPQPDRVAGELVRVCKPGGRIIMGNWTPDGFAGKMFQTIGKHVPPSPLMESPVKWGDRSIVKERLRDGVSELQCTKHLYPFRFPFPPSEVVEFFRRYYGPLNRAFASLDEEDQATLRNDLEQLWIEHNRATNGQTYCESEYLHVSAIRT